MPTCLRDITKHDTPSLCRDTSATNRWAMTRRDTPRDSRADDDARATRCYAELRRCDDAERCRHAERITPPPPRWAIRYYCAATMPTWRDDSRHVHTPMPFVTRRHRDAAHELRVTRHIHTPLITSLFHTNIYHFTVCSRQVCHVTTTSRCHTTPNICFTFCPTSVITTCRLCHFSIVSRLPQHTSLSFTLH